MQRSFGHFACQRRQRTRTVGEAQIHSQEQVQSHHGSGILGSCCSCSPVGCCPVRGELHQRRRVSQDAQFRAVEKVVEALRPVYILLEHADVRVPSPSEIGDVMRAFERECQRWEPTLPPGAKHLRISVRQALANCFGSPAAIAVDPEAESRPMRTFDR